MAPADMAQSSDRHCRAVSVQSRLQREAELGPSPAGRDVGLTADPVHAGGSALLDACDRLVLPPPHGCFPPCPGHSQGPGFWPACPRDPPTARDSQAASHDQTPVRLPEAASHSHDVVHTLCVDFSSDARRLQHTSALMGVMVGLDGAQH